MWWNPYITDIPLGVGCWEFTSSWNELWWQGSIQATRFFEIPTSSSNILFFLFRILWQRRRRLVLNTFDCRLSTSQEKVCLVCSSWALYRSFFRFHLYTYCSSIGLPFYRSYTQFNDKHIYTHTRTITGRNSLPLTANKFVEKHSNNIYQTS